MMVWNNSQIFNYLRHAAFSSFSLSPYSRSALYQTSQISPLLLPRICKSRYYSFQFDNRTKALLSNCHKACISLHYLPPSYCFALILMLRKKNNIRIINDTSVKLFFTKQQEHTNMPLLCFHFARTRN